MIMMTWSFFAFFYLSIIMMVSCSSSSSVLLSRLRKHKTISFQSKLSSPIEINVEQDSKFHITCSFLSNFDIIDIFWLHNGTLIESFISESDFQKEDNKDDSLFLGVSIVSTITIEKARFDMNGYYQCIGVHQDAHAQQTFNVHVNTNEKNLVPTDFSKDAKITVHTAQALFETRSYITLMCRLDNNRQNECKTRWFDSDDQPIETLGEKTDLVIKDATFRTHMGLYTCEICCFNQCQKLTSFVYPAEKDK